MTLNSKVSYLVCGHCIYTGINAAMEAVCKENKTFSQLAEYNRRAVMVDKIVDERHAQLEQLIKASNYSVAKYEL